MSTPKTRLAVSLGLAALAVTLAGCASRDVAQVPTGMKVGPPLTTAQIQAIQQRRQAGMQQRAQGQ